VFFIDHFFRDGALAARLPAEQGDLIIYVATAAEPTTDYMDVLAAQVRASGAALPCCMVALGGGATMDACKAVANLMTNPGLAEDYQGWELVKNPPVYKIAVPTLAGTGSECSRTCVLSNVKKRLKLGMNSDHTVFDQVIMDPELTRSVPRDQFFHTGMDTYMHCFETLTGSYRNRIVDALAEKAVAMCEDIFLSDDMMSEVNLEKMMIASYLGGMATGYVGVVHPFSAGLSVALHMRHGIANCYALPVLEDIYPAHHAAFMRMKERQQVSLPGGVCRNLHSEDYEALYAGTIVHENSLSNRLGPDFKNILTKEDVIERFKRM
jgi:3-deoxy-alpha-D-manno-octulosonate 8-oxidase